jgi:CelD/BcsL family acetyltransferase involved in cellulose biosynthesis
MSSTAIFRTDAEIGKRKSGQSAPIFVATSLGPISLRVVGDVPPLQTLWEQMQAEAPCTAAQTYDWAKAWTQHVLEPEGNEAAIAVGYGPDVTLLFLWAFEIGKVLDLAVLKWLGQDHANYNMGLFEPGAAAKFNADDLDALLREVARETGAAAALLKSQPFDWDGVVNPFAKLPHQPAPSTGYAITLGDFPALYDKRFSKRSKKTFDRKQRNLAEVGPLAYNWAESPEDRLQILDIFFAQKSRQLAAMGVNDVFSEHVRAFYEELALLEGDNPAQLRLGYVKVGDQVLATFSGTICHNRISVALSSLAEGELLRQSPGSLLLRHQISEASAKGLAFYDIGVGAAQHKEEWCDVIIKLFDSFIAFKPQGQLLTLPIATAARIKRAIKGNRHVWGAVQRLRRTLLRRGPEAEGGTQIAATRPSNPVRRALPPGS